MALDEAINAPNNELLCEHIAFGHNESLYLCAISSYKDQVCSKIQVLKNNTIVSSTPRICGCPYVFCRRWKSNPNVEVDNFVLQESHCKIPLKKIVLDLYIICCIQ